MKNHIALTSCADVAEIMLPLLKPHGMTVFNYYRVYFDGRMIRFSSDKAWTEHYLKKNYMMEMGVPDAYLTKPLNYFLWLTEDCPKMLLDAALNFNTSNGISIAEKHPEYIEYFCFATTLDNTRIINNFYLNNLDVLKQYGYTFREKAQQLIQNSEKTPIQLLSEKAWQLPSKSHEINSPLSVLLSNRQAQCADLLLKGMTSKQIGRALDLSPRTIEGYIEDMKIKLQCQNKASLIIRLNEV